MTITPSHIAAGLWQAGQWLQPVEARDHVEHRMYLWRRFRSAGIMTVADDAGLIGAALLFTVDIRLAISD
jgi:hypothetical protein